MAAFATPWPFRGIMQMKYEQLLDARPEWVREVGNEELTAFLEHVEETYQRRVCEVLDALILKHEMGPGQKHQGDAYAFDHYDGLVLQAKEIAREEALGL